MATVLCAWEGDAFRTQFKSPLASPETGPKKII